MKNIVLTTAAVLVTSSVLAQAPVYNRNQSDIHSRLSKLERMAEARSQVNLLRKVHELSAQVQQLTGKLEEQTHEIAQLKRRQNQFVVDFDKRLKETASLKVTTQKTAADNAGNDSRLLSEEGAYQNAYQLIKMGDYDSAIRAFRAFLEMYPDKRYAVNAHYWLGELYLAKRDYAKSEQSFQLIIDNYGKHVKAPDAMVKLGFLFVEQGNTKKASDIFNQVKSKYPKSSAASLAQARLEQMKRN